MTSISIYRPLDSIVRQFLGDAGRDFAPPSFGDAPFRANIEESDDAYRIRAELPGVGKDDITLSLEDRVLSIGAKFSRQREEKSAKILRAERVDGNFARGFHLSRDIAEDKITAELKDGVLTLNLPKQETAARKSIAIS